MAQKKTCPFPLFFHCVHLGTFVHRTNIAVPVKGVCAPEILCGEGTEQPQKIAKRGVNDINYYSPK